MRNLIFLPLFICLFVCCNDKKQRVDVDWKTIQEQMIVANKGLVKSDSDSIAKYIVRQGWNMHQTETGLWYEIYEHGSNDSVRLNDVISIAYRIELLDSTLCYESNEREPKIFKVGQGGVETGLEEGVLKMCRGDRARFILPPHLAHGVLGDQNKIPRLAIIKYDVFIESVSH